MSKILRCGCDMGSIKIFNSSLSAFFSNEEGDGLNTVCVHTSRDKVPSDVGAASYQGHFTVKAGGEPVYLSSDDCEDDAVHEFTPGRWWVYLRPGRIFDIVFQDMDTHA